jgi:hypothetical protein
MKRPLLLAAALALAACISKPTSLRIDPALATIVPPDTTILVGAKLDKLRDTEIYRKYFQEAKFAPLDEFQKRTGLDARKDLWELVLASNGKDGVILARGRFGEGEMEPRLQAEGATRFAYKGRNLYGNDEAVATSLNMSTWIVGPTAAVKRLIDEQNTGRLGIPEALKPLVASIPYGTQFWAVYGGGAASLGLPERGLLANAEKLVRSVQTGTFAANLASGADLKIAGSCDTDANAKQVHDAVKALVGIGRLATPQDQPELLQLWDGIVVVQDRNHVRVSTVVPLDRVERFVGLFRR